MLDHASLDELLSIQNPQSSRMRPLDIRYDEVNRGTLNDHLVRFEPDIRQEIVPFLFDNRLSLAL